jgi:alkaline phosphatase D
VGSLGRDPRASNPPRILFSLHDYRTRLSQYRTDIDLLLSHQKFAWIPVWDDHEVANNGYRDGFSAMNNTEESFLASGSISVDQRKMNAVRAYFEWMPIRQVSMDDNLRIWRNFRMGKLLDLIMLDTRNYDRSITTLAGNDGYIHKISDDAGRSLMGSQQENWFYRKLSESADRGAAWRIIGNQIIFSRMNDTSLFTTLEDPFNGDQWDGYMANKNRTFQHLYDNKIGNNIMLAGDSHANWVSDLVWLDNKYYDPKTGRGAIGVEFAGTAVSSTGWGKSVAGPNAQTIPVVRDNTELQWSEGYYRGYFELQINYDRIQASFFGMCFLLVTYHP